MNKIMRIERRFENIRVIAERDDGLALILEPVIFHERHMCSECGYVNEPNEATHAYYASLGPLHFPLTQIALICNGCNEWTMYL